MRLTVLFLSLSLMMLSCKKKNESIISLGGTNWDLYYKNNNTFTFYAHSLLYFNTNDSVENFRNFDTVGGTWKQSGATMSVNFTTGDKYTGTLVTNDNLSGTLTASGNDGVWYATKR